MKILHKPLTKFLSSFVVSLFIMAVIISAIAVIHIIIWLPKHPYFLIPLFSGIWGYVYNDGDLMEVFKNVKGDKNET